MHVNRKEAVFASNSSTANSGCKVTFYFSMKSGVKYRAYFIKLIQIQPNIRTPYRRRARTANLVSMEGFPGIPHLAINADGTVDPEKQLFRPSFVGVDKGPYMSQVCFGGGDDWTHCALMSNPIPRVGLGTGMQLSQQY